MNPRKQQEIVDSIYLLRRHNEWWCGGDGEMPSPTEIGIAIGRVCDAAESSLPIIAMITKQQEIEDPHKILEKTRRQLDLAIDEIVKGSDSKQPTRVTSNKLI